MTFHKEFPCILLLSCLLNFVWAQELIIPNSNRSFEFSMVGKKNQTGHWITRFKLSKSSTTKYNICKVNLQHSITEYGGVQSYHLLGTLIAPPPKPEDYELFPGIGYYKFHHGSKVTFAEASSICSREGGHLAIINSEEESNVIKTIYARHMKTAGSYAYIGFIDQNKARNFVTIYGQSLSTIGFLKWHGNEPNNIGGSQFCGCIVYDGLLCDVGCSEKITFFCEYDLTWSDL